MKQHQYMYLYFSVVSLNLASFYGKIMHTAAVITLLVIVIFNTKIHSLFSSIQTMAHMIHAYFGDSKSIFDGEDTDHWKNSGGL